MAKSVEVTPTTKEQWAVKEIWRIAAYCRVSTAREKSFDEWLDSLEL